MKDSNFYIREIKRVQGIESDYAVAQLLDISRASMTKYKKNALTFDSHIVFKVAELSGHDPVEILLNMKASKEKDPAFIRKWSDLARRMASTAACVILSLFLITALPANVDTSTDSAKSTGRSLYIMLSSTVKNLLKCIFQIHLTKKTENTYTRTGNNPIPCAPGL